MGILGVAAPRQDHAPGARPALPAEADLADLAGLRGVGVEPPPAALGGARPEAAGEVGVTRSFTR